MTEQPCFQLGRQGRLILRSKNGLCHNIGLALCYLDIILKSIIWAGAPMVDRISSLSQDRLHVSGRVRGAERDLMLCHAGLELELPSVHIPSGPPCVREERGVQSSLLSSECLKPQGLRVF